MTIPGRPATRRKQPHVLAIAPFRRLWTAMAVCSLGDPLGDDQCEGAAGGQTCQPWYEEGAAPPGYELVGACALPQ